MSGSDFRRNVHLSLLFSVPNKTSLVLKSSDTHGAGILANINKNKNTHTHTKQTNKNVSSLYNT